MNLFKNLHIFKEGFYPDLDNDIHNTDFEQFNNDVLLIFELRQKYIDILNEIYGSKEIDSGLGFIYYFDKSFHEISEYISNNYPGRANDILISFKQYVWEEYWKKWINTQTDLHYWYEDYFQFEARATYPRFKFKYNLIPYELIPYRNNKEFIIDLLKEESYFTKNSRIINHIDDNGMINPESNLIDVDLQLIIDEMKKLIDNIIITIEDIAKIIKRYNYIKQNQMELFKLYENENLK